MKRQFYRVVVVSSLALAGLGGRASAQQGLSAWESFVYDAGDLALQGEASNGWDGPWEMVTGVVEAVDGNLEPDTEGRCIQTVQDNPGGEVAYFRGLADVWPDDGQAYWIGFMFQRLDDGSLSSWGGFSLFLEGSELLFMGSPWQQNLVGLDCTGMSGAQASEVSDMQLNWVVVKLAMNGTSDPDSAYLWVNPDPSSEPNVANADAQGAWNGSDGFNRVRIGNDMGYILSYDGIRLGTSFDAIQLGVTAVREKPVPAGARASFLGRNYPNPFNPVTRFEYGLDQSSDVSVKVYTVSGKTVATLVSGYRNAGVYSVEWNAAGLPSGVYVCVLEAGGFHESRRISLLK
jgi:hypothetical protein